jgi:hypothetical protein
MVPSAGLVIPTPPEVFPTTSPETTRDSAPIWVDFVRCGLPEVSAVIFDIFEFWVGPIGSGWRDQNVLNGFVSFASPKAGGPPPRSSLGLPPGGVPFGVAADWLTAKRFNLFGNPWVKMEVESYAYPRDLSDQRRVFFIASALAVPVKLGVFSSLLVLDICEITLCETVKSVLLASRVAASNPKLTVLSLFYLYGLAGVKGVVCMSCQDGIPGCEGGTSCPYFMTPMINSAILGSETGTHDQTTTGDDGAEATITHTLLVAATVLPRVISRFLSRGVLDFFKTVARRPTVGSTVEASSLTEEELVGAVKGGSVTPEDALNSLLVRMSTATTQLQVSKLTALVSTIGHLSKLNSTTTAVGTGANGELLGVFTFAYTQAGRVAHHQGASLALAGEATSADTTEAKAILQAKILRPRNQAEFFYMLTVWSMLCHAMGVANALATNSFVLQVVFDQMSSFSLTWQQAHELFLVYLEAVETSTAERGLTMANVYSSGGQDMYREKAIGRAKEHFKSAEAGPRGDRPDPGDTQRIFRGAFNSGASKCCITFNLGRDKHPQNALDAKGKCLFNHKCDHFVSEQADGTKGGVCGSTKHGRHACDNAKRVDAKVAP